jgi:hypothetical protein
LALPASDFGPVEVGGMLTASLASMAMVDLLLEAGTMPGFRLKRTTGGDNTISVVFGSR